MPFSKEMILGASGNQGAAGFYTHQIEQSCRFDYVDNSHFDRNYGDAYCKDRIKNRLKKLCAQVLGIKDLTEVD